MKAARRHILGVDVDSTVWDVTAWVCEAVQDVTGERLDPESGTTEAIPIEELIR